MCAWHELGVDVELTTSSGDQMAVLQRYFERSLSGIHHRTRTCEPKSRIRIVSNWSWISAIVDEEGRERKGKGRCGSSEQPESGGEDNLQIR